MKYTIESTKEGCVETLEFAGSRFTRRTKRVTSGYQSLDSDFGSRLEDDGFGEEITEKVFDLFDGFISAEFLDIAYLENQTLTSEKENADAERDCY